MNALGIVLIVFCGMCFFFGVVYPLAAMMFYPLYKKLGGKQNFKDYVRSL